MQFTGRLRTAPISATESKSTAKSLFEEALTHPSFPTSMLEESLAELEAWGAPTNNEATPVEAAAPSQGNDAMAPVQSNDASQAEIKELKKQLASLQRIQKVTFSQLSELREEKEFLVGREKKRADRVKTRSQKKKSDQDVDMNSGGPDSESD
jgi:pre-rRNA-processing protein IPI3